MSLKQNKLISAVAILALLVVAFIFWRTGKDGASATRSGMPMQAVPSAVDKAIKDGKEQATGILSDAKNSLAASGADADTPDETLKTLTSEVASFRTELQRVGDKNRELYEQLAQNQLSKDQIKRELKEEFGKDPNLNAVPNAIRPTTPAPAGSVDPSDSASPGGVFGKGNITDLLPDFGFNKGKNNGAGQLNSATLLPSGAAGQGEVSASPRQARKVLPMGVSIVKGPDGRDTLARDTLAAPAKGMSDAAAIEMLSTTDGSDPKAKKKDKPYFTIPENATLIGATAMTAIVGRVPVDGHVQDPMQFKLLLGPQNLAANGQVLPPDLAGIVVSGIAVGDMTLSCSEGLIQSMTFVFADGTIRTTNVGGSGGMGGGGRSGGQAGSGLSQMAKLGYLSDRYGNPCITGRFVTNAPQYLTDVIGLKALSIAGKAAASSQTTSTTSALGTSSSSMTGNRGTYMLGETVAGATDEVTSWMTRRMANSFDAVVTPAGAEVVVHINQQIALDKAPDARRLDYGRLNSTADARTTTGARRHGLD